MTCPKCGNEGRGRFCPKCGIPLVAASAATPGGAAAQASAPSEPTVSFPQLGYCECGTNLLKLSGACYKCSKERVPACSLCDQTVANADGDKIALNINENGFCQCGNQRLPKLIDHMESRIDARSGAVCDRGLKHDYNMDRMAEQMVAVNGKPVYIQCVCDGVSGSSKGADAAEMGAQAALEAAARYLSFRGTAKDACVQAVRAAQDAVLKLTSAWRPVTVKDEPPCSTILVMITIDQKVTYAWLGDSRLYWATETGCGCLVKDDSWYNSRLDAGLTVQQIEAFLTDPNKPDNRQFRRAVTRSLGSMDADPAVIMPNVSEFDMPPGCILIGCSDGLHVYADAPGAMAALVRPLKSAEATTIARSLIEYAKGRGGSDNITAAVYKN